MQNFKHIQSHGTNSSDQNPTSPAGSGTEPEKAPEIVAPSASHAKRNPHSASSDTPPLSPWESKELAECEKRIEESQSKRIALFSNAAMAAAAIHGKRLYRQEHPSFEAYCKAKWGFSHAHANRLACAGRIIERQNVSPGGDIKSMDSEAHYRPLAKLDDKAQDAVIDIVGKWKAWDDHHEVSPRMVRGAVLFLNPPARPKHDGTRANPFVEKFLAAVENACNELPKNADQEIKDVFVRLRQKATALGDSKRSSVVEWTLKTWNPLQGCCPVSAGCERCYAAKLAATRLADVHPGLAQEVIKDGKTTYVFKNIIRLLPEQLGDPLRDLTPSRYFVNSMSDLFHDKVPEDFITAVFDVMIKAHWHTFQVLTKRPERMAEFTTKYFAGKKLPPNIWLGASAENQKALDERLPHLRKVVAAVRWLSCEPLIGPIQFDSLKGIHWIVAGGESGTGARKMELAWATSLHDACRRNAVAFFFKQRGPDGPDGAKRKKVKKDGLTPPALEGKIHNA